jgi:hypothetical protein
MVNEQNILYMIISIIQQFNNRNNPILLHYLCLCFCKDKHPRRKFFMVNDTISDLLTRIRNANLRHDTVDILNTK